MTRASPEAFHHFRVGNADALSGFVAPETLVDALLVTRPNRPALLIRICLPNPFRLGGIPVCREMDE